ncbi:MAG TPA: thioesterase [Pyrinomonadaceae bacterium]|nr:thioesterase [Pyrinomonadaceae bacterium]
MLNVGDSAEASLTVRPSDTAQALSTSPEDSFPEVFATSRMIALMEMAAARLMRPLLRDGQLSVGVSVNVSHAAATPVGCKARAVATYAGPEGKLFRFRVEAFDEAGLIGEGEHTRAVVDTARLLAGAARRKS